jgi:predicted Zn finger-like uncharacterized protein
MHLTIDCSFCKTHLRVPENAAGRTVRCPRCGTAVRVPGAEVPLAEAPRRPGPPHQR